MNALEKSVQELYNNYYRNLKRPNDLKIAEKFVSNELSELLKKFSATWTPEMIKQRLELSLRRLLLKYKKESKGEEGLLKITNLIDISFVASQLNILDETLSFTLLEDLVEMQGTDELEGTLNYVETRIEFFAHELIPSKGKGLIILRMCNEMMRRISKSKMSVFCGRILLFVSKIYPLSERSGVNLRGDFNLENLTYFEKEIKSGNNNPLFDFYLKFWSLQKYFYQPVLCLKEFNSFREKVLLVLDYFEQNPLESNPNSNQSSIKSFFYPKYLTNFKLFNLQLRDISFRKQIIIQILIVVQYLQAFSPKVKENLKPISIPKPVLASLSLNEETEFKLSELRKALYKNLQAIDSNYSNDLIRKVLKNEQNYIKWKNENCYQFDKLPSEFPPMKELNQTSENLNILTGNDLGNEELNRLWNSYSSNLVSDGQSFTLENFLEPLDYELDPENDIEKAYRHSSQPAFQWKALRLTSKYDFTLFQKIGHADIETLYYELKKEQEAKDSSRAFSRSISPSILTENKGPDGDEKDGDVQIFENNVEEGDEPTIETPLSLNDQNDVMDHDELENLPINDEEMIGEESKEDLHSIENGVSEIEMHDAEKSQ